MKTEELRSLISYDAKTGELIRNATRADNARAGQKIKCVNRHGYIQVVVCGKFFYGHRLAWQLHYGEPPQGPVDHKNGIRTDNRIANLRVATAAENIRNSKRRKDNASGSKNVHWNTQKKKWAVTVHADGVAHCGGSFHDIEKAAAAATALRARLHSDFARDE